MNTVLLESLLIASSGLLSLGSITIVILLLISDKGWLNGLAYASGYTIGYGIIGLLVILFGIRRSQSGSDSSSVFPIFLLLFGILLLIVGIRNYRKPENEVDTENRYLTLFDNISPMKAYIIGTTVSVINFKNLALFFTAVSVIVLSNEPLATQLIYTFFVVLVFCSSVVLPVGIYHLFPNTREEVLTKIRMTIEDNSRRISIWLPLLFGLLIVIRGAILL